MSRRDLIAAGLRLGAAGMLLPSFIDAFDPMAAAANAPLAGASKFVPVTPTRLADTRLTAAGYTRVSPTQISVPVRGQAGITATASAVAVIVTAFVGAGPGFVTAWPHNGAESVPNASLVNNTTGETSSNIGLIQIGDNGGIEVTHSQAATSVFVDVVGYFEPVASSADGRFVPLVPARVLDTRQNANPFEPGETRPVNLVGVPPDAVAAVVNVIAVSPQNAGLWTLWPGGSAPDVVNLHTLPGGNRAAGSIVALTGQQVQVLATGGGHCVVDLVGYFTGPSASPSSEGLFVPCAPQRVMDTRSISQPIPAFMSREVMAGPAECSMVAVNVTVVNPAAMGYGVLWAAGDPKPGTSTINFTAGRTVANTAIVRAGARGVAVSVSRDAHVLVDLCGWFTGARSTFTVPRDGWQPYGVNGVNMEAAADEWFDYGWSAQGRPLRAFRYGTGPRRALIATGLHGNEHSGESIVADLVVRGQIPGWTLMVIPCVNPDARAANVRYIGADMNRDWPLGFAKVSKPTPSGCIVTQTGPAALTLQESQLLRQALLTGPFQGVELSMSHHDNYNWVAPQSGSPAVLRTLATEYARAVGLRVPKQGGAITPTSISYTNVGGGFETFMKSLGAKSFLVENKAGYVGGRSCGGKFGLQPAAADVALHYQALKNLLSDGRLPH